MLPHMTGVVRFDQEPRSLRQPIKQLSAFVGFEVERDASFVAVLGPPVERAIGIRLILEERSELSRGRAAGRFDLDDVGAEVAENLAAEQTAFCRQIEN